jgi:hypothetical protein
MFPEQMRIEINASLEGVPLARSDFWKIQIAKVLRQK